MTTHRVGAAVRMGTLIFCLQECHRCDHSGEIWQYLKKQHVHFLNDPAISPVRIDLQDTIPRMQKVHVHKVIPEQLFVIATYLRQHRYTYIGESSVRSHNKE